VDLLGDQQVKYSHLATAFVLLALLEVSKQSKPKQEL